jgi:hypothetical protein
MNDLILRNWPENQSEKNPEIQGRGKKKMLGRRKGFDSEEGDPNTEGDPKKRNSKLWGVKW